MLPRAGTWHRPGSGRGQCQEQQMGQRDRRDSGTWLHPGVWRGSRAAVKPAQPPASHVTRRDSRVLTPQQGLGGFSTAPVNNVAAHLAAHLSVNICSPTVLPSAPAAPNSAKNRRNRQLGSGQGQAGRDPPGSCPWGVSSGVGPSRGEGVKIQALSGSKRWMGSGEGTGDTQRDKAQKAFVCGCAELGLFAAGG